MKEDPRVINTKNVCKDALIQLLNEKNISSITISELCRKARINRNTFYCHYTLVEDVRDEIESQFTGSIIRALNDISTSEDALLIVCRQILENKLIYTTLSGKNNNNHMDGILGSISFSFTVNAMNSEKNELTSRKKDMLSLFAIHGANNIIQYWAEHGMKESPEEISEFTKNAVYFGIRHFTTR